MKKPYSALRKKIRGWKRRVNHLNKWGTYIKYPYTAHFVTERGDYTYDRYTVSPFYRLEKRHPPLWFFKLIIKQFVTAAHQWEKVFDELGVPYDLQIWIYDPEFIRSEIICYKMQEAGERKRFSWESDLVKNFPFGKFGGEGYKLDELEWTLADDEIIHFESDFEYSDFTEKDLLKDGYQRKTQSDGEVYYSKRTGDIWIGRLKHKQKGTIKSVLQEYYPVP